MDQESSSPVGMKARKETKGKSKMKSSVGVEQVEASSPELSKKKRPKKDKRRRAEAEGGVGATVDEAGVDAKAKGQHKGKSKKSMRSGCQEQLGRDSEHAITVDDNGGDSWAGRPKTAAVVRGRGDVSNGDVEGRAVKRPRTRSMDAAEVSSNNDGRGQAAAAAATGTHPSIDEFDISDETKTHLRKRGISSLFPIQAQTYAHIRKGKDLIGRARTGMGKTLAFAIPVIEKLLASGVSLKRGRHPRVLVMAPTRELAKQVASDFELTAPSLETTCIYGGAPYRPQELALSRGLDIVVGTPGRLLDHVSRGTLRLLDTEFIILDEADQMLDMGFKEEMEKVFEACGKEGARGRQMLLFSATMPPWVDKVVKEYMKDDRVFIDLVKEGSVKASKDVEHIGIPCHWSSRTSTISDIISVYAAGGNKRTIVFCSTKRDCNDLCMDPKMKYDSQALHGDITQANRESTLAGFKKGSFKVLVATDVAARGLDMIVDLVLNSEPPSHYSGRADTESYVHRSGRTGRAGRKGMCITLYTPRQRGILGEIERHIGNDFSWRGAPQPDDIVKVSAQAAVEDIRAVGDSVAALYRNAAEKLVEEKGAVEALSAALACMTGQTEVMSPRSLLSNSEGFVTVMFKSERPIEYVSYCWNALRRVLPNDAVESVRGMQVAEDGMSCVFDVAHDHMDEVLEVCEKEDWFELCTELPPLKRRADESQRTMRGGRGGRGGRVSFGGGGRGRGRGDGRRERGGGRGSVRGRGRGRGRG